jgi:hypothetical protein
MLVVALVSLAMGGGVWGFRMSELSRHYADRAHAYETGEKMYRQLLAMNLDLSQVDEEASLCLWSPRFGARLYKELKERQEKAVTRYERRAAGARAVLAQPKSVADYFADRARKYARAARYPWLHVEPDPPER